MATTASFAVPATNSNRFGVPQTGPSPPNEYYYGKPSAYATPMSQTPPSVNGSPTNVFTVNPPRQIKPPRQPLYTPAALRPTDHVARPTDIPGRPRALDTPPTSKDNSFDSGRSKATPDVESPSVLSDSNDLNDFAFLRRGLSRAASEVLEEEFGEVTGVPTTAHWKPDESAPSCYICNSTFTFFFRRHHCRRCGNLVCDAHFRHSVPLDQNARYNPKGTSSKACNNCWEDWKIVKRIHHSRTSSIAESSNSNSSQGTAMAIPASKKASLDVRVGSMARSEGMVWSTF